MRFGFRDDEEREEWQTAEYWQDAIVIKYMRKSLVLGQVDRNSIERQDGAIAAFIKKYGLNDPVEYTDAQGHRSGRFERTRKDWLKVKAHLERAHKAILIINEQDRMSRSVLDTGHLIEWLKTMPWRYRLILLEERFDSIYDGWDSRVTTDFYKRAISAQEESDKTSERMKKAIRFMKRSLVPWGTTPKGFLRTGEGLDARWAHHKELAPTILQVFEIWLMKGATYESTASELNRRGLYYVDRRKMPTKWTTARVRQIIANVLIYAGYLAPRSGRAITRRLKFEGEGTLIERYARALKAVKTPKVDPIILDEMACGVLAKRQEVWREKVRNKTVHDFMLSPILFWKGVRLRTHVRTDVLKYYATRSSPRMSWNAENVDAEMMKRLAGVQFPKPVLKRVEKILAEQYGASNKAKANKDKESAIQQMADLLRAQTDPRMKHLPDEVFEQIMDEANKRKIEAERVLNSQSDTERLMKALDDLGKTIGLMTVGQRRGAVQALFERVEIDDAGCVVGLKPREWAVAAFKELREMLPLMIPTGVEAKTGTMHEDRVWMVEHLIF